MTPPHSGAVTRPVSGAGPVVVAAVLWGTTGTATHFAPGVPAFVFGAVTFGLGGVVLAGVAGRATVRALTDRATRSWALLGASALVVYAVVFYAALADAGVALGTTIAIGTSPVFAGLLERIVDRRPFTARWSLATTVAVGGMVLVTVARSMDTGGASVPLGIVWSLVAGLTYALYSWAVARGVRAASRPSGPPGRGVVGAVFGLAAVPLVVLALVVGHDDLGVAAHWPVFLYLALVPTVLGHSLYAAGLQTVSASVATLLSLLEPVVAAVLAVAVVGERLGLLGWGGVALVVLGLGLLARPGRGRAPTGPARPRSGDDGG